MSWRGLGAAPFLRTEEMEKTREPEVVLSGEGWLERSIAPSPRDLLQNPGPWGFPLRVLRGDHLFVPAWGGDTTGAASLCLHRSPLPCAPRSRQLSGGARSREGAGAAGGVRGWGARRALVGRARASAPCSVPQARSAKPKPGWALSSGDRAAAQGPRDPQSLEIRGSPIRG